MFVVIRKFVRKIKQIMQNNKILSIFLPLINKLGFIGPAMDEWEHTKSFRNEYASHADAFAKIEPMLADELSRKTYRALIKYRKAHNKKYLKDIPVYPPYFQKDIFGPVKDEVFVDCGAYTGDTIKELNTYFGGGVLEKDICLGA